MEALTKAGVESATILELSSIFSPSGPHGNLFNGLETHYKQQQYYLHFVVSVFLLGPCTCV